jgi:hypothetical protein
VTSPADDPNAALLQQLQAAASVTAVSSNDDVLAFLNAEPDPDPLADVDYTGDEETDARAELDALHRGFRERTAREAERMLLATETEYWFCICFRTRKDKEAFLGAAGLIAIGDKYLDGYATAKLLGVAMLSTDKTERG